MRWNSFAQKIFQSVFVIPVILQQQIFAHELEKGVPTAVTRLGAHPQARTLEEMAEEEECDLEKLHLVFSYNIFRNLG